VDLTQLMAEEKGLNVDMTAYEEAKKQAQVCCSQNRIARQSGLLLNIFYAEQ